MANLVYPEKVFQLEPNNTCELSQLIANQTATVVEIDPAIGGELRHRLLALGVYPGARLQVLRCAPLGDPMQVKVDTSLISIRKSDARAIKVVAR